MQADIYSNLNKGGVSVKRKGESVTLESVVRLKDVAFIFRDGEYNRALQEQTRNVHAFARGELIQTSENMLTVSELNELRSKYKRIRYNLFSGVKAFIVDGKPINSAKEVLMVKTERFSEPNKQGRRFQLCELFLIEG